jgi:hypothetical protein
MTRAVLSTTIFDPEGFVALDVLPESALDERRRRVNRVATLDGAAAFNDFGFSDADRTFTLRWVPTDAATEAAIDRLVQTYPRLLLAVPGGVFLVAPEILTPGGAESTLILLVERKLTA